MAVVHPAAKPLISGSEIHRQPRPDFVVVLDISEAIDHAMPVILVIEQRALKRGREDVAELGTVSGCVQTQQEIRKTLETHTRSTDLWFRGRKNLTGATTKTKSVSAARVRKMVLEAIGVLNAL